MREFIVATESNADLSKEYVKENNICVIPHYYTVDIEEYGGDKELTHKEFYDEMRAGKKVGTGASNPAVIHERFTEIAKEGKDILFISFSSALSSGINNIRLGAEEIMEEFPECKIIVIDTLSASVGEAMMVKMALELKADGKTIEETANAINEVVPHLSIVFSVDDLEYLYRGGRLSKTSAVLGSLIQLKPLLKIDAEGKLTAFGKVRGRKKSMQALLDEAESKMGSYKDKQSVVGIMHGDCIEDVEIFKSMITEKFGYTEFMVSNIGPSIGAHSGPGTLGFVYLGETR